MMEERGNHRPVYAGLLMCPSGHLERGETPRMALSREMREELGIVVEKSQCLFRIDDTDPHSKKRFRHSFMLVKSYEGEIEKSAEAKRLRWLTLEEISKENTVRLVKKFVSRLHGLGLI